MKLAPGSPLRIALQSEISTAPEPVGLLASANGTAQLQWDPVVIQRAINIDPGLYRPEPGLWPAKSRAFEGLHGFLSDSLPDAWGSLLVRLQLRKVGFRLEDLNGIDRLALVGGNGRGALIYAPATSPANDPLSIDLDELAEQSRSILLGEEIEQIETLATLGGSSGGARPKVHLGIAKDGSFTATDNGPSPEHEAWIVKFRASSDPVDIGPIEEAYAQMARLAGISMAETRLLPASAAPGHFATRRFDRPAPGKRIHMVSLSGAIEAPWQDAGNIDYDILLRATAQFTRHAADVEEAFRRMVFNVLAHNRDDHSRQHSYLMDRAGQWRLAPAYDLTYSSGPGGEHYLAVRGEGRNITREHVLALGAIHGLSSQTITSIIDQIRAATNQWTQLAASVGVATSLKIIGERLEAVSKIFG
jgi:serine/threonine-protein kinase HipA